MKSLPCSWDTDPTPWSWERGKFGGHWTQGYLSYAGWLCHDHWSQRIGKHSMGKAGHLKQINTEVKIQPNICYQKLCYSITDMFLISCHFPFVYFRYEESSMWLLHSRFQAASMSSKFKLVKDFFSVISCHMRVELFLQLFINLKLLIAFRLIL